MLAGPAWLALEVKYLDRARSFYEAFLELDVRAEREGEVALDVGPTDLVLRRPTTVPRGGLHTHFALSIPDAEYEEWFDRLDERFDLVEHEFGDSKSLYFYDTEGNCVELGQSEVAGPGVSGLFEVVLEVQDLDRSLDFYESLGFEPVDRSGDRPRIRLTTGSFDLELWEPHLGIADARGGVHVDLGMGADDPVSVTDAVGDLATDVVQFDGGIRVRDPDGHHVSFVETA